MKRIMPGKWLIISLFAFVCLFPLALEAKIYRWMDETGIEQFTNDEEKIPSAYKEKVTVTTSADELNKHVERTVIDFERKGNSILVNATLNHQLPVLFHLDTGATETLITPQDANELGIKISSAPKVRTRLADGREAEFAQVRLSSLRIGNSEVRNFDVLVGEIRLLGLSFLHNFKVSMDSDHGQLILDVPDKKLEPESDQVAEEKTLLRSQYDAKVAQSKISMEQVQKNIQIVESQIENLKNRQEMLSQAYDREKRQANIDAIEASMRQIQLAIENNQLEIEKYKKDLEVLQKNIDYYQNMIYKLQ